MQNHSYSKTIKHLENPKIHIIKNCWKRLILIVDNASFHMSKVVSDYVVNAQKADWLTITYLSKKAPYLNPNGRKVNQQIKSDVCANRFYVYIKELKDKVSEYLDKRFRRWNDGIIYD